MTIDQLRGRLHDSIDRGLVPVTRHLARLGVLPSHVTVVGTVVTLGSPVLLVADRPGLAGLVWLTGSSLDLVDGALARHAGKVTRRGAFLDSTLDRVAEGALFAAIAYRFAADGAALDAALAVVALLGSLLISYTRARAEALGIECRVGLVTRAERILLLGLGLCLDLLAPVIYVLVVLTAVSVAQRVKHSLEQLG